MKYLVQPPHIKGQILGREMERVGALSSPSISLFGFIDGHIKKGKGIDAETGNHYVEFNNWRSIQIRIKPDARGRFSQVVHRAFTCECGSHVGPI